MKYRADIDGLRALAVLPVLLFHAGVGVFGGGYVGVDVFFVISGYLITGIIIEDVRQGRFTVAGFYDRRIRRIMPALLALLACVFVAGLLLFLPGHMKSLSESIAATVLFCSNVLFYRQDGYFTAPAEIKPLLHTWSLAVEEQFYIFFPVLLWLIHRYRPKALLPVLAPIAILSFALAAWGAFHKPSFAFFLAPTRIWELFAGAFLALGVVPAVSNRAAREALAGLGVALIAWAVFAFTPDTVFPGVNALYPVLGAALLIHAAPGTATGRVLALRPLVFVGLISYSLYLWHWPIIVFSQYALMAKLAGWTTVVAIAASLVMATLSWRFVERPFRDRRAWTQRQMFRGAAASMAVLLAAGLSGTALQGWPGRFPPEVRRLESAEALFSPRRDECHSQQDHVIPPDRSCRYGAAVAPAYVVWGDSHAVELAYALGETARAHGEALEQMSYSACPPAMGFAAADRPDCPRRNDDVLAYLGAHPELHTVILTVGTERYVEADQRALAQGIVATVDRLHALGRRVVMVYPVPAAGRQVPAMLARMAADGIDPGSYHTELAAYRRENAGFLKLLDSLPADRIALRIHPDRALCATGECRVYGAGDALYFDDSHPSIAGARLIARLFEPMFAGSGMPEASNGS